MAEDQNPQRNSLSDTEKNNKITDNPTDSATNEPVNDEPKQPGSTADSSSWQANAAAAKESGKAQVGDEKIRFRRWKNFWRGYWRRKKWTIPLSIVLVLGLVLGVPLTRYAVLGLVIKRDVIVVVQDAATQRPVSGATVSGAGKSAESNGQGQATLHLPVGPHTLAITKKYYKSGQLKVQSPLLSAKAAASVQLRATGRQVPVVVKDKIGGKVLANVEISVLGTTSKTDKDGKATLALPTTAATQKAKLAFAGFNTSEVSVQVTADAVPSNTFSLTPTGKLYFLSNQSGTIDVVKTNLDGSERKTVLAGTGSEDGATTSLLASRDWKYLALLSKRTGQQAIYLINTSDDSVTNIDGGSANTTFSLVGWSNDIFVYNVTRTNIQSWQSGAQALKSYDAATQKLYSIDQTQGEGTNGNDYGFSQFSTTSIIGNDLIYGKSWFGSNGHLTNKTASLMAVRADGTNKRSIKDFPVPESIQFSFNVNTSLYEPQGIYVQVTKNDGTGYDYYEYENGQITSKPEITDDTYNKPYPTYLLSPSGKQTFWSDLRDNKNSLFIGTTTAGSLKQIASLSEDTPYGWYSDNYLLVSNNGSQLYIMPVDGSKNPLKVTDYYKPQVSYRGYGGGYGGL